MKLSEKLLREINETTNVTMFVDESANIFWVTKDENYVWISQDSTYNKYLDETHLQIEQNSPEGVSNIGVYWNNQDFNNPYHVTDFEERIATINI